MKKYKVFISIVVLVLLIGCGSGSTDLSYKNIDAPTAYKMSTQDDTLLLDVRTPAEYVQGHIENSVLIPVQVLKRDYTKILAHKDKKILIYCRSGNRSVTASNILLNNGFNRIYNLKGGIKAWIKNRYPVQKGQ